MEYSSKGTSGGSAEDVMVTGVTFRNSTLIERESLLRYLERSERSPLEGLAREYAVLSTCNRIEFYASTRAPAEAKEAVAKAMRTALRAGADGVPDLLFYRGVEAVQHLFEVASGLDSIVLGEPQILSQVRRAGSEARTRGSARGILSPLFDRSYRVGTRIRQAYDLGSSESSMSDLAVDAVLDAGMGSSEVLLIGTGKMVQLASKRLKGSRRFFVASRRNSIPRGLEGCSLVGYSEIPRLARRCQVIISATSVRKPILSRKHLEGRGKKVVVDLGMPRNVSGSVRNLPNVRLFDLDDLGRRARRRARTAESRGAFVSARNEAGEFYSWLVQTRLTRALADVHSMAARVRDDETRRALSRLGEVSPHDRRVIEAMGRRIASRLMSRPTEFARRTRRNLSEEEKLDLLSDVFGLRNDAS